MMRFNSPYDLLIRIPMILNLLSGFCNCKEICKQPEWKNFTKVIFVNDSYRYSHHYHYSQTISLNQPHPFVIDSFKIFDVDNYIEPEFPLKYYGSQVTEFKIWSRGVLSIFENNEPIGQITNVLQSYVSSYLLTENELFAARWSLKGEDNGSQNTPIVTNLIYANGKISIYYENNILQTPENKMLGMQGIFQCETGRTKHEIFFPAEWIRNGTLVEYEVIGTICPIHNSSEACQQATTSKTTCIWCEKWNTCIDSNHQDHHFFKVNDCHFKSPDVSDVSTSTLINHKGRTLGITDVQVGGNLNETTEITQESRQNKSLWYLFIIIPLIISIAACTGYVNWKYLHKRRRSSE